MLSDRQHWLLSAVFLGFTLFALVSAAKAADASASKSIPIAVSPVIVKMDVATEFSSIEVSNRGERATGVELEILKVSWVDGKESYAPTKDFIVSPPAFRIQPEKGRMVRFRYTATRQPSEGFYRLFVRQLLEDTDNGQINMVFNLGVPIFVAPLTSTPAIAVGSSAQADESELRNTGNVTLTLLQLEGACPSSPQKLVARLSPDQKLVVKSDTLTCMSSVRTDRGPLELGRP